MFCFAFFLLSGVEKLTAMDSRQDKKTKDKKKKRNKENKTKRVEERGDEGKRTETKQQTATKTTKKHPHNNSQLVHLCKMPSISNCAY